MRKPRAFQQFLFSLWKITKLSWHVCSLGLDQPMTHLWILFLKQKFCLQWPFPINKCVNVGNTQLNQEYCKFSLVRQLSLYCLVDELRQGGFVPRRRKKIKIKIYILTLVGGKNKKKVGKWLFIVKINKFNWNICSFGKKNPLIFRHVGGKIKKIMKCQFFFLVGHNFTASEDLVDQTI